MLAFLGWNPGTTQEIFSLEQMIEAFSLERVSKAGAKFDADKTNWFQQQYLRAESPTTLAKMLREKTGSELQNVADAYLRSEEHTSELQSRPHLVCRLLLEKKKMT